MFFDNVLIFYDPMPEFVWQLVRQLVHLVSGDDLVLFHSWQGKTILKGIKKSQIIL